MKVLIDMNLSPRWAAALADEGFEAVHWATVGQASAPDSEIFAFAARGRWVVLTHDLDFGAILAGSGERGPSVVQIRGGDLRPDALAAELAHALRRLDDVLRAGALVTLDSGKTRVRVLPFLSRD